MEALKEIVIPQEKQEMSSGESEKSDAEIARDVSMLAKTGLMKGYAEKAGTGLKIQGKTIKQENTGFIGIDENLLRYAQYQRLLKGGEASLLDVLPVEDYKTELTGQYVQKLNAVIKATKEPTVNGRSARIYWKQLQAIHGTSSILEIAAKIASAKALAIENQDMLDIDSILELKPAEIKTKLSSQWM